MKIAIYSRVSTIGKGQDPENQLAQLREFAAKQNWEVVHQYVDFESGAKADRESFQQMFKDASQRKFDLVLFWALDRFGREGALKTLQHLDRLESYGVGYRSFSEPYFDSCGIFKEAVVSIVATLAKQERVRLSERTRAGLARVRASGKRLGRPAVRVDAEAVRRLRAEGVAWAAISRQLGIARGTLQKAVAA
jgi:DNA invertase Pin-like site-specific DNA recombinase